jgi:hypothetical protein
MVVIDGLNQKSEYRKKFEKRFDFPELCAILYTTQNSEEPQTKKFPKKSINM